MKFSLRYLAGGLPTKESQRFRNRLGSYIRSRFSQDRDASALHKFLEAELGVKLPSSSTYSDQMALLFEKGELRDVLDAITLTYEWLDKRGKECQIWKDFVARVLKEENVGYTLDDNCDVHYLVDEVFQENRSSTLRSLQDTKYTGVRGAFDDAYRHFDDDPQDTKAAVRSIYEALEILAKQLKPAPRLTEQLVYDLRDMYGNRYDPEDQAARTAHNALFAGMADWVKGLQVYRHGQGVDRVIAPDEIMCVHILSTGTSYIRWLIDLENKPPRPTPA